METECEIAVDLRSDGVVYGLHRDASILRRGRARRNAGSGRSLDDRSAFWQPLEIAVHPMVTVPTMFHGRVAVLLVGAKVAAIQEGQFGFNFSRCLLRDSKSSYICNSGRALRPRRARPANNSFTEFYFNQAWLAES